MRSSSTCRSRSCPHDQPCLRRPTPRFPGACAVSATHSPRSCPRDKTHLGASTPQLPTRWNSARCLHLPVAQEMNSPRLCSPRSCLRDELAAARPLPRLPARMSSSSMRSPRGCPGRRTYLDALTSPYDAMRTSDELQITVARALRPSGHSPSPRLPAATRKPFGTPHTRSCLRGEVVCGGTATVTRASCRPATHSPGGLPVR